MDKVKATEFVELALEALRSLEEAVRDNHQQRINLETEALRGALFNILELLNAESAD